MITWDNLTLLCALLAVLMRLLDRPQAGSVLATLTLLSSALAQRAAHRRKETVRVALESSALELARRGPSDRATVAGNRS